MVTDRTEPPVEPRPTTTSLGAFRDLQNGPVTRLPWWHRAFASRGAPGTAVAAAAATAVLTVALVIAVSLRSVRYGAPTLVSVGQVVVVLLATLAVAAGLVAVLRHSRSGTGGRFRAAGSIVVAIAATFALFAAIGSPPRAERGGAGQGVIRQGVIPVAQLAVGDCLTEIPPERYDNPSVAVPGLPCSDPHLAEVVAVEKIPAPGADLVAACEAGIERLGTGPVDDLRTAMPTEAARAAYGVGLLVCLST